MLKKEVLDGLLLAAAANKKLVDLRLVVRAQYTNWPDSPEWPPYINVQVTVTDEKKVNVMRKEVSQHLVARYHEDVARGALPLAVLFVGEKTQLPGPPLRQLVETTRGEKFATDEEWVEHWQTMVRDIYKDYNGA